jgi:cell division protein FtsW (lipid II flippase)
MLVGLISVALLLMPLLPIGLSINGARLWVRLGEFQFQPGEFGKLFFALFLGAYLARFDLFAQFSFQRKFGILVPPMRQFGPVLMTLFLVAVILVFERDLGTALLLVLLFVTVTTVATARIVLAVAAVVFVVIGGWLAANLFDHVDRRFEAWLSPFSSPDDTGYQILQSIFGLAAGGIFGEGLGSGSPNLVPFASSDFILSVIGEEAGYAGLLAILGIFTVLIGRAVKVALDAPGPTNQLMAFSLTSLLAIQLFLVAAGITRLLPLTGLTTPFLSYGGSSMLTFWLLLGVLIKISNENNRPKSEVVPVAEDVTIVLERKSTGIS